MLTRLSMHGHMRSGVQDLPALLTTTGFTNVEAGTLGLPLLGFVRSQTPAS